MSSLISGYEYDIFISYRHKDNKYDGWVSEFVANLTKELAATFKEDVSIYFDENPHDGILDTDVVDQTIGNKIKCLIFIPVISHTYCDPQSFAWNHEFAPFIKAASSDRYGINIRLKNGNIGSRLVAVRIHDLDEHDRQLIENATGTELRAIDFVFKAPGINRPLRTFEDRPHENVKGIYYRDQINKVANQIREIIRSMRSEPAQEKAVTISEERQPFLNTRRARVSLALVGFILLLSLYLFFFNSRESRMENDSGQATLAVIPFRVAGQVEEVKYFADGVMESILSNLSSFPGLKARSRTSVERYRTTTKSIPEIADELNVNYVLEGSVQKVGDKIRIIVQLVDGQNDLNMWSQTFDGKVENVFDIQNEIIKAVARQLKSTLTPEEEEKIYRNPTDNFKAYDLYLRAKQLGNRYADSHDSNDIKGAIRLLEESLKHDPEFALAYGWLAAFKTIGYADATSHSTLRDSIVSLANKALSIDSTLIEPILVLSEMYSRENEDVDALRYTYEALGSAALDSALAVDLVKRLASLYSKVGYTDRALKLYDAIHQYDRDSLEVLHLKFYALAADHRVSDLLKLADQLRDISDHDPYIPLIMTHVWIERLEYSKLGPSYAAMKEEFGDDIYVLEQYALVYAWALRNEGRSGEATALESQFDATFGEDDFYKAQLLLFRGDIPTAVSLLKDQEIGWYNLNLIEVNPLFHSIKDNAQFVEFMNRNREALRNKRERIRQLEAQGFLPPSENFIIQTNVP